MRTVSTPFGWRNGKSTKQKISPCLWFDGRAEKAAEFYTSIFPNCKRYSGPTGFSVACFLGV